MARGKRDAATVLLELLEIVPDAAKLERMLEPANLYLILMARGRDKATITAALKTRLPGELLLEVLKEEKDPEALLALCTAPILTVGAAAGPPDPFGESSSLNKFSSFALIFSIVIPAMIIAGFFPAWDALSQEAWIAIATIGAALSGAGYVAGRAPWWVGALGGALVAPGAMLAIYFYTRNRTTVLKLEIAAAFLAGSAPGIVAYYALFKKVVAPST